MAVRRIKLALIRKSQSVQSDCEQFASVSHALNAELGPQDIGIVVAPQQLLRVRGTRNDVTCQALDTLTTSFKALSEQLTPNGVTKMILLPGTIAWNDGARCYQSAMMYVAGQAYRFDQEEDVEGGSLPRTALTSDPRDKERIQAVTVSGVTLRLGFEICSDHVGLGQTIDDRQTEEVDIHFLASDSIHNSKHDFCARDGGLMIHSSTKDRESLGEVSERYAFDPATGRLRYRDGRLLDRREDSAGYDLAPNGDSGVDVMHRPRVNYVFKRIGNVYTSLRKSFAPGTNVGTIDTQLD